MSRAAQVRPAGTDGRTRLAGLGRGHWGRADAWVGVGSCVAAVALVVVATALGTALYGGLLLLVFPLAVVHAGSVPLALVRPRAAAACSVVGAAGLVVVAHEGLAPWPWSVTSLITQSLVTGLVGYRARMRVGVVLLAVAAVSSGVLSAVVPQRRSAEEVAVDLVMFTSIAGVVLVAGIVLRRWGDIRGQLVRERRASEEERARRRVAEEKTRIARELHDVIAHSMSLITVQAASAPARLRLQDEATRQEFLDMAASSRRALTEMRSLLSVLRDEDAPHELAPQPGLADVQELVDRAARSGAAIELRSSLAGDAGLAGVAAYRIVQEAVSNALRHVDHPRIVVSIDQTPSAVELEVANDAGRGVIAAVGRTDDGGSGLFGMRERALGVGGILDHGVSDEGGYVVRAHLPVPVAGAGS